jgi:hypothetical protein
MDNAPAHTAVSTREHFEDININHFKSPAQSPDLNPIELVWHDMKVYISGTVKPNTIKELADGIIYFWNNQVTVEYCNSKINHLKRVLKTIILKKGKATGM